MPRRAGRHRRRPGDRAVDRRGRASAGARRRRDRVQIGEQRARPRSSRAATAARLGRAGRSRARRRPRATTAARSTAAARVPASRRAASVRALRPATVATTRAPAARSNARRRRSPSRRGIETNAWAFDNGVLGPPLSTSVRADSQRHDDEQQRPSPTRSTSTPRGSRPMSPSGYSRRASRSSSLVDANDPGVFMYHCETSRCSRTSRTACTARSSSSRRRRCRRRTASTSSSRASGSSRHQGLDRSPPRSTWSKRLGVAPADWVTWNGYAGQYVKHPLTASPG